MRSFAAASERFAIARRIPLIEKINAMMVQKYQRTATV